MIRYCLKLLWNLAKWSKIGKNCNQEVPTIRYVYASCDASSTNSKAKINVFLTFFGHSFEAAPLKIFFNKTLSFPKLHLFLILAQCRMRKWRTIQLIFRKARIHKRFRAQFLTKFTVHFTVILKVLPAAAVNLLWK